MTIVQVLILSVIQGACELLPVSSSAHVLVVAKMKPRIAPQRIPAGVEAEFAVGCAVLRTS
jgi:undecaprenyl pyrophosphate phosphatase UppP